MGADKQKKPKPASIEKVLKKTKFGALASRIYADRESLRGIMPYLEDYLDTFRKETDFNEICRKAIDGEYGPHAAALIRATVRNYKIRADLHADKDALKEDTTFGPPVLGGHVLETNMFMYYLALLNKEGIKAITVDSAMSECMMHTELNILGKDFLPPYPALILNLEKPYIGEYAKPTMNPTWDKLTETLATYNWVGILFVEDLEHGETVVSIFPMSDHAVSNAGTSHTHNKDSFFPMGMWDIIKVREGGKTHKMLSLEPPLILHIHGDDKIEDIINTVVREEGVKDLVRTCLNTVMLYSSKKHNINRVKRPAKLTSDIVVDSEDTPIDPYIPEEITLIQKMRKKIDKEHKTAIKHLSSSSGGGGVVTPHWRSAHWRSQRVGKDLSEVRIVRIERMFVGAHHLDNPSEGMPNSVVVG